MSVLARVSWLLMGLVFLTLSGVSIGILDLSGQPEETPVAVVPSSTPPPTTAPPTTAPPTPTPTPTPTPSPEPTSPPPPPPAAPVRTLSPLERMRLEVPRLGISLPLTHGNVQRDVINGATPEWVALLYPSTNVPGTGGNSFVYAHARTGMFLSLWEAQVGDEVRVITGDGSVLRYQVTQVVPEVAGDDYSWLDPSGQERLTLQTSTGPSSAYPRFIVVAVRVG